MSEENAGRQYLPGQESPHCQPTQQLDAGIFLQSLPCCGSDTSNDREGGGGTGPADQLADGLLPVALRLGQLASVTSPLTLVIPDKCKFPDIKTFKLNELT